MSAPGNVIFSAYPLSACAAQDVPGDTGCYTWLSGTSMASPHVAGAAALYLQSNPGATPATVAAAIMGNATTGVLGSLLSGSPNKMLRVNGSGGSVTPPPPPPPPPPTGNTAPVPSFNSSCSQRTCSFVSTSTDDGGIVSSSWTFGDGTAGSGSGVSHTYGGKGSYTVGLTVRDGAGLQATTYRTVTIKQGR